MGGLLTYLLSPQYHRRDKNQILRSTAAAAAAAKSLQSCPTLCDPTDGSPPGSSVPGILQPRIVGWVAISSSNARKWKVKVKSLSCVRLVATPWLQPTRLLHPWDFPGKNTGVGCHFLLQCMKVKSEKWKWSHSVVSDSSRPHGLQPTRLLRPWDFPGKSTGLGCHCLLRQCRRHKFNPWPKKIPHVMQQLSLSATSLILCSRARMPQLLSPCASTTEALTPRAHALQQEKQLQWEAQARQQRVDPTLCNWRKALTATKLQHSQK